jgi:hypothetical protein
LGELSRCDAPPLCGAFLLEIQYATRIYQGICIAVFNKADNSSVEFLSQLLPLGIASRADAKPLVIEWAEKKYECKPYMGQRGMTFPQRSTARMAMNRVLDRIFGGEIKHQASKPKTKTNDKTDKVTRLVTSFSKLTAAEKRRFLASVQ